MFQEETKMRKLHKLLGIALATTLCATTICMGASCKSASNAKEGIVVKGTGDTIAVIAKGETHAFWQAVKAGAEAAGKKYGFKVTFRGPTQESESYVPEQREMLSSALADDNTRAIVLATIGMGFVDELKTAYSKGIPIVEFDSGLYANGAEITPGKDPVIGKVATDNKAAAALVAENFFNYLVENNKLVKGTNFKLGIIQHDSTATGVDRHDGFKNKFSELSENGGYNVTIIDQIKTNNSGEYREAVQALQGQSVNAIYMTNEGVVNEVSAEVAQNKNKYADILFAGFDCGTNQYNWIKNTDGKYPTLVGSVAQDSYSIGYKAVEMAAKIPAGDTEGRKETVGIAGQWYTSANIDALKDQNIFYLG